MIAFIEKLNSEVLRSIERIESRDTDVLKKSLEASRVLGEAFDRLKQYIIGYRFQKLNSSSKCNGIHINNLFKFFVWCEVSKSFTRSII